MRQLKRAPEAPKLLDHTILHENKDTAMRGASVIQAALGNGATSRVVGYGMGETFAARGAHLRRLPAHQLVVVTEQGSLPPAFAGPQSYPAAAEQLRVTTDLFSRPTVHLDVIPTGDSWYSPVQFTGGPEAEELLKQVADYYAARQRTSQEAPDA